jgi:phosphotriesterase-related protein
MNRRGMLRLVLSGAAGSAAAGVGLIDAIAAARPGQTAARPAAIQVPHGGIIRTVSGDLDPTMLPGATLMHEHLGTGRPAPARQGQPPAEPNPTTDGAWMAEELTAAHKVGLGCIVAAQTGMPGPENGDYLRGLSQKSGVRIVAAAAYYTKQTYPPFLSTQSEDEIADGLVKGAQSAGLGAFGELGVANDEADMDPLEKKVFRAFGKAQARTGIPIFTHNNYSTGSNVPMDMALRQLDALEAGGANPKSIALGHVCCLYDPMVDVAKRAARRGAFIAFDRVTRQQQWVPDEKKVQMVKALLDAGLEANLLLSSDYVGRVNTAVGEVNTYGPLHAREGGPGYARPLVLFVPLMRKAGIGDDVIRRITQDNPRRFLTFVPKAA